LRFDLLLISNSTKHGLGYLEHARAAILEFMGGERDVLFVPYAMADHVAYTARVAAVLEPLGLRLRGLHLEPNPKASIESASVVYVGGGNSFRLLKALQENDLIEPVHRRVSAGELRYMGVSAGANMACPTLRTTNDMPIVEPASFESFGLIPFQINPHYLDPDPASTHMGETRELRIAQFLEDNDVPVLGIREGAWLRRRGDELHLGGATGARLFSRGEEPVECSEGADLSFLLSRQPHFDRRG
jgi:dipeptidase E